MSTRTFILAIAGGATAIVLISAWVGVGADGQPHAESGNAFANRFQPDPAVLAGIGSTRALKPVDLVTTDDATLTALTRRDSTDSNFRGTHHDAATHRR